MSSLLLATAVADHEPGNWLRAFVNAEDELIEPVITPATDHNVDTWLGPEADDVARQRVRQLQCNAFELWLAADDESDPYQ